MQINKTKMLTTYKLQSYISLATVFWQECFLLKYDEIMFYMMKFISVNQFQGKNSVILIEFNQCKTKVFFQMSE